MNDIFADALDLNLSDLSLAHDGLDLFPVGSGDEGSSIESVVFVVLSAGRVSSVEPLASRVDGRIGLTFAAPLGLAPLRFSECMDGME